MEDLCLECIDDNEGMLESVSLIMYIIQRLFKYHGGMFTVTTKR